MLKLKVACFAIFTFAVYGLNFLDFREKHCYKVDHASEFYKNSDFKIPRGLFWKRGYICENFHLTTSDLDVMATTEFSFTKIKEIFFKNCKIEYFNEYLASTFPNHTRMFFNNCTISFKNPSVIADTSISNLQSLYFEKCIINDNLNSKALEKFESLNNILFTNCTFQYPRIDKYLFRNQRNLGNMEFVNVNLKSFEKGLFANGYFPRKIKCESCQLEEANSLFDGRKLGSGIRIILKNNFIKELPIFENMKFLDNFEVIDLSENQIEVTLLKRSYFKPFKSLWKLDLSGNANITGIEFLAFNDTELASLFLSNVNLKNVNKLGSRYLSLVDLSMNYISSIPLDAFEELYMLYYLDLSGNKLKSLKTKIFNDLYNLSILKLNNNYLEYIHFNDLEMLPNLQKLYLNNNNLHVLQGIDGFKQLQELYLQDNSLESIPSLPDSLEVLDISKNPLIRIIGDTFTNTPNLRSLDLSSTNHSYTEFDRNFLCKLSELKSLKIKGNQLTSFAQIDLPNSLEELSLAYNEIEKVSKGDLQNLENLKYLNLSNNHMTVFEKETTEHLKHLEKLDISGNYIKTMI